MPDFAAAVPVMGGDVRRVVVHVARFLTWYAHDLVAGPVEAGRGNLPGRERATDWRYTMQRR